MPVTRSLSLIEDARFRDHQAPDGHPETAARLHAVAQALSQWERHSPQSLERLAAREARDEEILRVHSAEHLRNLEVAIEQAPCRLDADTFVSSQSLAVARLAAGSCVDLAMNVARGEADCGFGAMRPPGHHAEADRAMGFCLFNGVAIAARALQREAGIEKILILDWDVHHGNGSQHSFESDPSVLYFSTHQFPFYPGSGAASEAGIGAGLGATVNVPMPAGCGDFEYVGVLQHLFAPVALEFDPDFILVSCGFDAHRADPLGSMQIGEEGFRGMTQIAREVAEKACGGRIAFILEGGYSARGLAEGTAAVLAGLLEPAPAALPTHSLETAEGSPLRQIVSTVSKVHAQTYSCLEAR